MSNVHFESCSANRSFTMWMDLVKIRHQATTMSQTLPWCEPVPPAIVHCCTPSLCWLEAETGYRVGTPYMRQWNVWATAKAKFDGFCSIFLQKAHVTSISSVEFFLGSPKIIFTPSNGPFFRGTGTFPELRGPSQNWGAGLWEDPRRCCYGCW